MSKIKSNKLGMALGATGSILYIGCILIMWIGGSSGTTWLFNSIIHGIDVSSVVRMDVPMGQSLIGIIITFLLGWIVGYFVGTIYNIGSRELSV